MARGWPRYVSVAERRRKAARAMKAYLGLRDTDCVYAPETDDPAGRRFGIPIEEHNFARVRLL